MKNLNLIEGEDIKPNKVPGAASSCPEQLHFAQSSCKATINECLLGKWEDRAAPSGSNSNNQCWRLSVKLVRVTVMSGPPQHHSKYTPNSLPLGSTSTHAWMQLQLHPLALGNLPISGPLASIWTYLL